MAFTYCKSCGYKNMYTLSAPNFCGGCGAELSKTSYAGTIPRKTPKREVSVGEDFDPDGLDIFSVPKITKLSYSIEHSQSNKLKLEDLIPLEELEEFVEARDGEGSKIKQPKSKRSTNGKKETAKD